MALSHPTSSNLMTTSISSRQSSTARFRNRRSPIADTLGFNLVAASEGRAAFESLPELRHYNPVGAMHGGFTATLLDSALACAIFSAMVKGDVWTTFEPKLNYVCPLTKDTGPVRTEGCVLHRGRSVATSEGELKDRAGKLYAHATTTCMTVGKA